MTVVCDSSVLITLSTINQLHLLEDMFGGVLVPSGVYDEVVTYGRGRAGEQAVRNASFIYVTPLRNPNDVLLYAHPLSSIDAEVIILAKEQNAGLLLTRDGDIIKRARRENIPFGSLFDLFVSAKEQRHVQAVKPLLDEMRNEGILIREGIYQETLRRAGEVEGNSCCHMRNRSLIFLSQ